MSRAWGGGEVTSPSGSVEFLPTHLVPFSLARWGVGARFGCLALSFKRLSAGESAAKATALMGNTLAEDDNTDVRTTESC